MNPQRPLSPIISTDTLWSLQSLSDSQIKMMEKMMEEKIEDKFNKLEERIDEISHKLQFKLSKESVKRHTEITGIVSRLNTIESKLNTIDSTLYYLTNRLNNVLGYRMTYKTSNTRQKRRAPSGLVVRARISDELANFFNLSPGTLMARTDVTKRINFYIKNNKLQDPSNRRIIIPDQKLRELLNYDINSGELSYFNLQRYLNKHF